MKIEYLHASKFGNGASVAEQFKKQMAERGVDVEIHHIREVTPSQVPPADLYLFSSPGRFGKPIRAMRRFLQALTLPPGTEYALLTTEAAPKLNKKTGKIPTEEELVEVGQRVRPMMKEILQVLREVWLPGMREARAHRVPIRITGILGQALLDRASPVSCARRSREARDVVHGNGLPKV